MFKFMTMHDQLVAEQKKNEQLEALANDLQAQLKEADDALIELAEMITEVAE